MKTKSIELAWIVVKDFPKAVKFYTETVGLKLLERNDAYGWAELQGQEGGAILGICQEQSEGDDKAGQNACVTFTVEDIDKALLHLKKQGAKIVGKLQEIPGNVKMQKVVDADGNILQVVQMLSK